LRLGQASASEGKDQTIRLILSGNRQRASKQGWRTSEAPKAVLQQDSQASGICAITAESHQLLKNDFVA
jgi:hypothetical protein